MVWFDEAPNLNMSLNDIILPQKSMMKKSVKNTIIKGLEKYSDYGAKWEDYVKLGNILKKDFPEYYDSYNKIMNGNKCYSNNMFICSFELADKYFNWLFNVLNKLEPEIDFSKYPEDNKRVFGFFSETLLTVFVEKHDLRNSICFYKFKTTIKIICYISSFFNI